MSVVPKALHSEDPREKIWSEFSGFAKKFRVLGNNVLVAVYVRPETVQIKNATLYLPQTTVDEDKNQGKVGLVLAKGPTAFMEDETHHWGGVVPQVGDWVVFKTYNTWPLDARTDKQMHRVRLVEDVFIWGVVDEPDIIY